MTKQKDETTQDLEGKVEKRKKFRPKIVALTTLGLITTGILAWPAIEIGNNPSEEYWRTVFEVPKDKDLKKTIKQELSHIFNKYYIKKDAINDIEFIVTRFNMSNSILRTLLLKEKTGDRAAEYQSVTKQMKITRCMKGPDAELTFLHEVGHRVYDEARKKEKTDYDKSLGILSKEATRRMAENSKLLERECSHSDVEKLVENTSFGLVTPKDYPYDAMDEYRADTFARFFYERAHLKNNRSQIKGNEEFEKIVKEPINKMLKKYSGGEIKPEDINLTTAYSYKDYPSLLYSKIRFLGRGFIYGVSFRWAFE